MKNISDVLTILKDIPGFRFYLIVFILAIGSFIFLFKDEIVGVFEQPKSIVVVPRDVKNISGFVNSLNDIVSRENALGYVVYVYQPHTSPILKQKVIQNLDVSLRHIPFRDNAYGNQSELNKRLARRNYIYIESYREVEDQLNSMPPMRNVLIYPMRDNGVVAGEVHLFFKVRPEELELHEITNELDVATYIYGF